MKIKISIAFLFVLTVFIGTLSVNSFAAADTCTWTGMNSGSWADGGNWSGCDNGAVPESGDALNFPPGAFVQNTVNDLVGLTLTSITITDNVTLAGNPFSLTGGFVLNSPTGAIVGNDITLAAAQNFDNAGAEVTFSGVISGAVGNNVTKIGTGGIYISGDNTFDGNLFVNAGYVGVGHSNALGSTVGVTVVNLGGTLSLMVDGLNIPENIAINGSGNVGGGSLRNFFGDSTISGNVQLNSSSRIQSDVGNILTIIGVIHAAVGNDLTMRGQIVTTGANTVSSDTLLTGNSSPESYITFNGTHAMAPIYMSGGTVLGTGTIADLYFQASASTAVVYPGTNGTVGTLTVEDLVASGGDSAYHFDITHLSNDMIIAGGTVNLTNSAIFPNLFGADPANGETFTLIDNDGVDPVTGTFAGYPEGASYVSGPVTLTISYVGGDGNDVVFTAAVAATPTPTHTPSSSSSFSTPDNPFRDPGVPSCDSPKPSHSPDLFQIDATTTSARLFFAPAGSPNSGYFIAYGTSDDAMGHGVAFDHTDQSGVVDFTIDALKPNTTYYFKVRGQSGCMPGDWSQIMKVKTGPSYSAYWY